MSGSSSSQASTNASSTASKSVDSSDKSVPPSKVSSDAKVTCSNRAEGVAAVLQKRVEEREQMANRIMELDKKLTKSNQEIDKIYTGLIERVEKVTEITNKTSGVSPVAVQNSESTNVSMTTSTSANTTATRPKTTKKRNSTSAELITSSSNQSLVSTDIMSLRTSLGTPLPNGRHTASVEVRLARLESMFQRLEGLEQNLNRIVVGIDCKDMVPRRQVAVERRDIYGCRELQLVANNVATDLQKAITALDKFNQLPAFYAQTNRNGGLRDRTEVTDLRKNIEDFIQKLQRSMDEQRSSSAEDVRYECTLCGK